MFEFRSVELMNWAYWPTMKMPLDQPTIMITGPNGSGKTTFLDALRVLLRAPRLSANRRFTDYLVAKVDTAAIKAVVTNDYHQRERRPFEFKGFKSDLVTLAVIMHRRSGRWERRYVIAEGDLPLADLQKMPKSHMLSPQTYTRELAESGFTAAFLKVLALEQGQTDKLCEKSPRELLDLLLEVHGDKQVIERYKEARENYHKANLELSQIGARLAEEQAKVLASEKAAKEYQRWAQLTKEKKQFEEIWLPQAEYKAAKEQIEQSKLEIDDLNMRLGPLDRGILDLQQNLDNADTELERRRMEVETSRELKVQMETKERDLDIKLNSLMTERRKLEEVLKIAEDSDSDVDLDDLFERRARLRREMVRLELQIEEVNRNLNALQQDVLNFDVQQRKVYPRFVEDFIRVLDHADIKHDLLCDIVDVKDKAWQLAIESILGRDRFTVIVDEDDQLAARQLGQQHGYRCYVATRESTGKGKPSKVPKNSALEQVEYLDTGVPDWLTEVLSRTQLVDDVQDGMNLGAKVVSVTRQGYRQDRRGGISIAVDRFYCGRLGQSSLKDDLSREVKDLKQQLKKAQTELADKQAKEEALQKEIMLQENLDQVQEAHGRLKHIEKELPKTNVAHKEALELKRQAEHKLIEALDALSNFERDCTDMRKDLLSQRNFQTEHLTELQDVQDQIAQYQQQMTDIAAKLSEDQLTEKALAKVEDLDELTPKYYTVRRLLADFEDIPEEGAVEVYEHHRSQYEKQRALYEEHEEGLRKWEHEFKLAREKYVVVVEHTIREYRHNVLALAEAAGVAAEVNLPDLRSMENCLEEAELSVRFGFDGKRATNMGGSSLSGGQRVVGSLILLMSLTTSGGINRGGFFIIDEPFAHLSLERIDDVTRFLDRSQCQFILTSPTTHNVNVFSAARLQMNFRIKPPGQRKAPIPTIIRR